MLVDEMREIVGNIRFNEWVCRVKLDGNRPYLQWTFLEEDMVHKTVEEQHSRKWFLSPFMTKSEIVSTAFKAMLTAVEHEAREQFRYRGRAIFGPHFDVDQLVEFARSLENIDVRTGQWVKNAA